MKTSHSSRCRSMDTVDNSHTDNTHIHNPGSHSRIHPAIQTQFRPKPEHQNAAREQKRIPRPPMQLREVFSSSLFVFSSSLFYPHRLVQLRLPSLSSQYFVSKASYLVGMGGVPEPIDPLSVDAQCPRPWIQCKRFQGFIAFGALVLQWLLRGRAGPRPTGLLASGRRGWEAFEANLGGHVSNACS